MIQTSLSSPRVSSSATDSAILIAVSIKFRGIFSCDNKAAICNEFKRKQEQANFCTSSSLVLAAFRKKNNGKFRLNFNQFQLLSTKNLFQFILTLFFCLKKKLFTCKKSAH